MPKPKAAIFTDKEIRFLKALLHQKVPFMIVGLSAATLQGAPVVTQDIDLWFHDLSDERIRKALRSVGGIFVPSIGLNPPMFAGKDLELFDIVLNVDGLKSFRDEIKHAMTIPVGPLKLKVLSLDRIIASKEAAGRTKDRLVLPVLRDAWKVIQKSRR